MASSSSVTSTSKLTDCCGYLEGGRKLVVCIDGSANKFSKKNTNVVEIYSHILRSEPKETDQQLTYYDSGIGTFPKPSWKSLSHFRTVLANKLDLAIAWNLEKVILGAYCWLSDNYQLGDKIYLFGFSRGAYQVRVLAGMIHTVGLILPGNKAQIPFAFELYADYDRNKGLADAFKATFSRNVTKVHFVGVWDTVSSIGIRRSKKMLPRVVDSHDHICIFRHALALDERRVKFTPEYIHEGAHCTDEDWDINFQSKKGIFDRVLAFFTHSASTFKSCNSDIGGSNVKEVWFAGSHSDIGGGNKENINMESGDIPLLWMRNEAMLAGLRLKSNGTVAWGLDDLKRPPEKSLTAAWWPLECLPLRRLSYKNATATTRIPHGGRNRKIVPGQKLHVSVIYKSNYRPRQTFPDHVPPSNQSEPTPDEPAHFPSWPVPLPHYQTQGFHDRLDALGDIWEKDLFDYSVLRELKEGQAKQLIHRIAFISTFDHGRAKISEIEEAPAELKKLLKSDEDVIRLNSAVTLCELGSLLPTDDSNHHIFADDTIANDCLVFITEHLFDAGLDTMDAAKKRAADAIPSLIKNEHLRVRLMEKGLVKRLAELWKISWDGENAKEFPGAKVRAACARALSHLLECGKVQPTGDGRVDCSQVLKLLGKEKNSDALSNDVQISAARILTHLVYNDPQSQEIVIGPQGRSVIMGMINPKSKTPLFVQAAYLKMLLSLTRDYGEMSSSSTDLTPILIQILTNGDSSLIPDGASTICNLIPNEAVIVLSFEILLDRMESNDKHKWTSSFHGLKSLAHHDATSQFIPKQTLVNALVKKMARGNSHSDAAVALSDLAKHPSNDEIRKAIMKSNFAEQLCDKFINGRADTSRLFEALHSFAHYDEIRGHIIATIVSPLVDQIGRGNFYSLKFAHDCVRPSLLKHEDLRDALLKSKLVEALQRLVTLADHYRLYLVIHILHNLDAHDNTRDAVLSTDLISNLVHKSKTHHILPKYLIHTNFSESTRSVIDKAFRPTPGEK